MVRPQAIVRLVRDKLLKAPCGACGLFKTGAARFC